MHITFAGTPKFSKIVLEKILKSDLSINAVITTKDKPRGRGQEKKPSPVKEIAERENLRIFHQIEDVIDETDLVLVAAYGRIFSKEILENPKYGFLNVHPSLLPKYRGPTPIQAAILNGDKKTGVTIMLMNEEMDGGPILNQREILLTKKEYYKDLEKKLAESGGEILSETVKKWVKEKITPESQNNSEATYTDLLKKEDGRINWEKSAEKIEREVRAYNPWPGCYGKIEKKLLKVYKASVQKQTEDGPFGPPGKTYLGSNEKIAVQTEKDFLLIEELQIEGGKKMSSKEFLQGNIDLIGNVLH